MDVLKEPVAFSPPLPIPVSFVPEEDILKVIIVTSSQPYKMDKKRIKTGLMAEIESNELKNNSVDMSREVHSEQHRRKRLRIAANMEVESDEYVAGKNLFNFKPKVKKGWIKEKSVAKAKCGRVSTKLYASEEEDSDDHDDETFDKDPSIYEVDTESIKEKPRFGLGKAQMSARGYFDQHIDTPVTTSDNTLRSFKPITHGELNDIVMKQQKEKVDIKKLTEHIESQRDAWMMALVNQHNVVLCGLGSKREVLVRFAQDRLEKYNYTYVLGYHPDITVNKILAQILSNMFGYTQLVRSPTEQMSLIKNLFRQQNLEIAHDSEMASNSTDPFSKGDHLFVVLHNIDGEGIRSKKDQAILSELASLPNVHMIATIDHVNSSHLWDEPIYTQFKWKIFEATTYAPYISECEFESHVMVEQEDGSSRAALATLRSLNPNSQAIFKILATYQLEFSDDHEYSGLPFTSYYDKCRAAFVTNNQTLFTQRLNEFLDHKIVKTRKNREGNICYIVNMDGDTIHGILDGLENGDEAD
eukprot:CFRG0996T1